MEEALESTEDSLDKLMLVTLNLSLGASICISSELTLDSTEYELSLKDKIKVHFCIE